MGHSKEFDLKKGENETALVHAPKGATLLGGGEVEVSDLAWSLSFGPCLVAADGGAQVALAAGHLPDAVIGDMDSIDPDVAAQLPPERLHSIDEQDSTDFDKALRNIAAPFVVAVGFTGARLDHELAVYHTLVAQPSKACIVLGRVDIVCHIPVGVDLRLPIGTRVSLFPMAAVTGRSDGLRWPIDGLEFHPSKRIGTSNVTVDETVRLAFDGPGMLLILPREHLPSVLDGLQGAADI